MKRFAEVISRTNHWVGVVVSPLVLVMMAIVVYEVVSRFVFNKPTIWVHETSTWLWGGMFILGGGYCLLRERMVNVDIVLIRLPPRAKAAVGILSFLALLVSCGVLIWLGSKQAAWSIAVREHSQTVFGPPRYPLKTAIPLAAFLLLLQGVVKFTNDLYMVLRGKELK